MKHLKNFTLITILFYSLTIISLFGQKMIDKDFYYEYKGLKYKSILELRLNEKNNDNIKGVKCFSNVTDTLKVYFIDSKLTDVLNIKDSLLNTICNNFECNFTLYDKYNPKFTGYNYFSIEEGYNNIGFFQFALIDRNSDSFLLIVIGAKELSMKTKSRINTMFGYLIL